MVSFFSENYYIYHYSNICSNSFIFMIILILFSIFLPFFTNIGVLDKFWKPNKIYTDHPINTFYEQYYMQIIYRSGNTLEGISPFTSFQDNDDEIKLEGEINKDNSDPISQVRLFFFFNYRIENVNFYIKSKVHLFYSLDIEDNSLSNIKFDGDLIFKQNKGLLETYFTDEDITENNEINDDDQEKIKNDPFNRDDDYYFEYKVNSKTIGFEGKNPFTFKITIYKPYYQDIIIQLPNYTNLKNKWILYSILFFPTLFVCYWLMGIVINNKIFKTRIKSDIPLKI